jgi:hypothetical protein
VSGDGVVDLAGTFANSLLVIITATGIAQEMSQGGEHRFAKLGWIAMGDEVSSIIGGTNPIYAWRDFTWCQFERTIVRYANGVTWDVNGYPNAVQYHFYPGVHADLFTLNES